MANNRPLPPLSLYVHLPWCVRKCPYCDFNSHALAGPLPAKQYMAALLDDLDLSLARSGLRTIESVFLGGGTPSLFPASEFARLLDRLRACGRLLPGAEITLEANPGTVERHRFAELAAIGVTRVSLGAQSFDPTLLARIGRIHGPGEIGRAAEELQAAGLRNFNVDIMFALPGQTESGAAEDIVRAIALGPAHISHYQLTIEPHTAFHRHPPKLPCEDRAWAMQTACQSLLQEAGFSQYEVSAFARPGRQCRHNLNYWQYGDYLGIGAGAHEKITDECWAITRARRHRHPAEYMRAAPGTERVAAATEIGTADRVFEFVLNAARLRDGFSLGLFEARTGLRAARVLPRLREAEDTGLLIRERDRWRASERGWRFLNDLQAMFLPEGRAA